MVADAASRHDLKRLADLGLQVSQNLPSLKVLHQKLNSFLTIPLQPPLVTTVPESGIPMSCFVETTDTVDSLPQLNPSLTGLPPSCGQQNQTLPRATSPPFAQFTLKEESPHLFSTIPVSNLSLGEENAYMGKESGEFAFHSRLPSFFESSHNPVPAKTTSTLKQHSVWLLPPSYDVENLHGITGQTSTIFPFSQGNTSSSMSITQ